MKYANINQYNGSGYKIGFSMGSELKNVLYTNINKFIDVVNEVYGLDYKRLRDNSSTWLLKLPVEYIEELEGLANGSGCSIELISQWIYCDRYIGGGCTSFIYKHNGNLWIGRNNDYLAPEMWTQINIINKDGCIPVMIFGLKGELFSGTGYNAEKLWVHYNYLPVWDMPDLSEKAIPPFVFLRMALETCRDIHDIELLLKKTIRDGGMNFFVVDGKENTYCVFECTCKGFVKRTNSEVCISGANHYVETIIPQNFTSDFSDSRIRQAATESILGSMKHLKAPIDFIKVLSNPKIERNNGLAGTVYSNVACPALDKVWFAGNGFPSASMSTWEEVIWKW